MKTSHLVLVAAVFVVVVAVVIGVMYLVYHNAEIDVRNRATAQQSNLEVVFDATWKIIAQQAQIADEGKEAFREIYPELMEGRYGNARGGALLSFIQEQNPQFELSLYEQVANSVEAQRINFAREQTLLLDLKREHDNLLQKVPSCWFVGGRLPIEVQLVTSSRTDEAFATGHEDEIDLFPTGE